MKKNKMLSLAAAMVLTSTSAMAFDAMSNGDANNTIVTHSDLIVDGYIQANYNPNYHTTGTLVTSGYVNGTDSNESLEVSDTQFGDALIYSAFKTGEGWDSEIVVTNTSDTSAVVAKVVLYAADDSRELIDFNIYLSANDVFKFNIDETGVSTMDDSIEKKATRAQEVTAASDADTVEMNPMGELRQITSPLPVTEGYAVVYAMAQAVTEPETGFTTAGRGENTPLTTTAATYHKDHGDLFLDYRELLDACRVATDSNDTWRQALVSNDRMMNGMIRDEIQAPTVLATCDDNNVTNYKNIVDFVNPQNDILFGRVTIANDTTVAEDSRILTLQATALSNYTAGAGQDANMTNGVTGAANDPVMMVWTAGEMATIVDRRIMSDGNSTNQGIAPDYNSLGMASDALTFEIAKTYYTYSDAEMANTLHITSPVKRPLVQLRDASNGYWTDIKTTKPYGEFDFTRKIYNEEEDFFEVATTVDSGVIVSPYNPDAVITEDAILIESGGLQNLQGPAAGKYKDDGSKMYPAGYVEVQFTGGAFPGIASQMTASTINDRPHTNWVYAPVK